MTTTEHSRPGLRLLGKGDYAAALSTFESILQSHPKDIASWFGMAQAQLALGQSEAARKSLARTLELAPDHAPAQAIIASLEDDGKSPEVLKRLARLAGLQGAGFLEHYTYAQALLRRGQDSEASKELRAALAINPESAQALVDLGQIAMRQGRADRASEAFRLASGLSPREWMPQLLHARALMALNEFDTAMNVLTSAVAGHPREVPLLQALYDCALMLGRTQKAIDVTHTLEELLPGNANPVYQRGVALITLGKPDEAAVALEEAMRRAPAALEPRYALSKVRTLQGREKEALAMLEEIHKTAPRALDPGLDLSRLYLAENRSADAERVLRALLEQNPDEPRVNLNLALAAFKQGRGAEAKTALERVLAHGNAELKEQARKLEAQISGAPIRPPSFRG
jgi:predicted Zn-dependent protease